MTTLSDFRLAKSGKFYLVTDAQGQTYAISKSATFRDQAVASLAKAYAESGKPVTVQSGGGWHYRNLYAVEAA